MTQLSMFILKLVKLFFQPSVILQIIKTKHTLFYCVRVFEFVLYKVHNISKYRKNMKCGNTTEMFGLKLQSS